MPFNFGDSVLVPFPFTSQLYSTLSFGEMQIQDRQAAKLLKLSVIKPVFATLELSLVIKQLGTLQKADQTVLKQTIAQLIG